MDNESKIIITEYVPTNWVNDKTPLNAANLNHIEKALEALLSASGYVASLLKNIEENSKQTAELKTQLTTLQTQLPELIQQIGTLTTSCNEAYTTATESKGIAQGTNQSLIEHSDNKKNPHEVSADQINGIDEYIQNKIPDVDLTNYYNKQEIDTFVQLITLKIALLQSEIKTIKDIVIPPPPRITLSSEEPFVLSTSKGKTWDGTIEYSLDDLEWAEWDGTSQIQASNGTVYLRGIDNKIITGSNGMYWKYSGTASVRCVGNIESLLNYKTVMEGNHPVMGDGCYWGLFKNWNKLIEAPSLPAIDLTPSCYAMMFEQCVALTTAPSLPAMNLAQSCYARMFHTCSSLINAPALPAVDLPSSCYNAMFSGSSATAACTSLISIPDLSHVQKMGSQSCNMMFKYCSALKFSTQETEETPIAFVIAEQLEDGQISSNSLSNMFQYATWVTTMPTAIQPKTTYFTNNELIKSDD